MKINNPEPQPITLNVEQASRALGLSRSTVSKFISTGELPSFMLGGRRVVRYADITAFVAAQQVRQDNRAEFRKERSKRGVDVRSKRRSSPTGVTSKSEGQAA